MWSNTFFFIYYLSTVARILIDNVFKCAEEIGRRRNAAPEAGMVMSHHLDEECDMNQPAIEAHRAPDPVPVDEPIPEPFDNPHPHHPPVKTPSRDDQVPDPKPSINARRGSAAMH